MQLASGEATVTASIQRPLCDDVAHRLAEQGEIRTRYFTTVLKHSLQPVVQAVDRGRACGIQSQGIGRILIHLEPESDDIENLHFILRAVTAPEALDEALATRKVSQPAVKLQDGVDDQRQKRAS